MFVINHVFIFKSICYFIRWPSFLSGVSTGSCQLPYHEASEPPRSEERNPKRNRTWEVQDFSSGEVTRSGNVLVHYQHSLRTQWNTAEGECQVSVSVFSLKFNIWALYFPFKNVLHYRDCIFSHFLLQGAVRLIKEWCKSACSSVRTLLESF